MERGILASKKNVIILSVVALAVVVMLVSYYMNQSRLTKQRALGGYIELVHGDRFPREVTQFVKARAQKYSYVVDLKTPITAAQGSIESNVRIIDDRYPLMGKVGYERGKNRIIYTSDDRQRLYGVAVNVPFLNATGMKLGDTFKMNKMNYQIRATFETLPDDGGKKLAAEPLLILKHSAVPGSGFYKYASSKTFHIFIIDKRTSAKRWENLFKGELPQSPVKINRWDS